MLVLRSLVGGIAQLVERLVRNEKVRGSNPLTSLDLKAAPRLAFHFKPPRSQAVHDHHNHAAFMTNDASREIDFLGERLDQHRPRN